MNPTNIVVAVRNRRLLNEEVDSNPPLVVESDKVVEVKDHRYTYDYVFGKDSSNQEVYAKVVKNKIPNLFEGFNVTILAYGSTGSGKTYTMGTDYDDQISIHEVGIIPQGMDDIFKMIESERDSKEFIVKVSYVEIYNEEIYDLGIPKGKFQDQKNKLQICEREPDKGAKELTIVEVKNLTQKVVYNTKQALQFLMKGSGRRHIGETAKNKFSSRSHAIFNVLVQQTDKSTGSGKSAKFQLVDLAGSERSSTSQTSGLRLKEGTQINKSLFQLSSVIMALTSTKKSFISYRSSKLTHLLRDSLGGNTYTVMIACVNPSSTSAEETLSTLRYAHTARKIKNQPKVNVDTAAEQLKQLQKENEVLSAELYKLRSAKLSATNSVFDSKASQLLESAYFQVNSLNEKLLEVEEMDKDLRNRLKSFYDILKEVAIEITPAAVTDKDIECQKEKIEAVRDDCYRLWEGRCKDALEIELKDSDIYKTNQSAEEEDTELNNSGDTSEEESDISLANRKKRFKEIKDRQDARVIELNSIQFALQMKENMCEQLNFIQDHFNSSIPEGKEIVLENQIKKLIQEKTELIKTMETEKLDSKENAVKVIKYEEKLKELKVELQKVKRSLQMKWETKEKVNMLKNQIEELKKQRVNLTKEKNQASKQCMKIEQQKNKDIMQLKKKERKQELQRTRMAENYESKIRVLERRVSRYETYGMQQFKNKKVEKPKTTLVNTGESIEVKVKTAIENNLMKLELQELEQDADSLEQNIKRMEALTPDDKKDSHLLEMKIKLNVLLEKIGTMKKNSLETKSRSCVLLDSLPNLSAEAKIVVKTLLSKCVTAKVKLTKHLNECSENFENSKNDMDKKMQMLITESELATQELEKKIEYLESQLNLKKQEELQNQETKEFIELTNFQSKDFLSETYTCDADGNEKTEDLDSKIRNLQTTCDEKDAEVAELKKQINDLQNRKKRTRKWLTRLSSEDADTSEVHEEKESMLEAYFTTDNEESFCNDKNDPDWRATPLHKQVKRRKIQVSPENPEKKYKMEAGPSGGSVEFINVSSEKDFLMTVKQTKCQCVGECKSSRCKCKKSNVVCTEACKCVKGRCINVLSDQI